MSVGSALIVAGLLLLANAFFVGAEFAVMSVRRAQIEPLVEEGVRGAKTTLYAVEHVSLMLAAAQLGITVCSTGLGAVAEPALAGLVRTPLVAMGLPEASAHVVGFIAALLIVIYLHVVLGEMVPKNLAVSGPLKASLIFAPPLVWTAQVIKPVIHALNWLANAFLRMFGVQPRSEVSSTFTADEVASIVARSQEEGVLEDEVGLLSTALEFSGVQVEQIMVDLDVVVSLPAQINVEGVEAAVAQTGFSRFPIHDDGQQIVGYLHVKDTLYATTQEERQNQVPHWRVRGMPAVAVHEDLEDALASMQHSGAHLALVYREKTPVGVLFLEDILEELVGEVRDSMQRRGKP